MPQSLRPFVISPLAALVTLALFLLMNHLIRAPGTLGERGDPGPVIEFGFEVEEIVPDIKPPRIPPRPPPVEDPPPRPVTPAAQAPEPNRSPLPMDLPTTLATGGMPVTLGPTGAPVSGSGDATPLVVIQPSYPPRAAQRGIEGQVTVEFTVTASGHVVGARVIDAQPPRMFERAALNAIAKWRFRPRIQDGRAVERVARQVLVFSLAE